MSELKQIPFFFPELELDGESNEEEFLFNVMTDLMQHGLSIQQWHCGNGSASIIVNTNNKSPKYIIDIVAKYVKEREGDVEEIEDIPTEEEIKARLLD